MNNMFRFGEYNLCRRICIPSVTLERNHLNLLSKYTVTKCVTDNDMVIMLQICVEAGIVDLIQNQR